MGTLATVGVGTYGVLHIELNYDSIWYMDQNSYQTDYYKTLMEVFPEHGERVEVYVGQIPYWDYSEEVLRTDPYIRNDSIAFWYTKFHEDCCVQEVQYCLDDMDIWGSMTCSDELGFKRRLFKFLEHNPIYVM